MKTASPAIRNEGALARRGGAANLILSGLGFILALACPARAHAQTPQPPPVPVATACPNLDNCVGVLSASGSGTTPTPTSGGVTGQTGNSGSTGSAGNLPPNDTGPTPIANSATGTPTPAPPPGAMIVRTCVFGNPYPGQYSTNFYGLSTTAGGSAFGYLLLAAWPTDAAACAAPTPTPPPPPPSIASLPCLPFSYGSGTAALDCSTFAGHAWSVSARVQSQCPINEVLRTPYPRTLVAMDTSFKLVKTQPDTHWSISLTHPEVTDGTAIEPDGTPRRAGLFRGLSIGLQSSRLSPTEGYWLDQRIPDPAWHFSDHPWNAAYRRYPTDQRSSGNGIDSDADALFAYETASWGLPQLGRNFDFALDRPAERYDLPAYRVSLVAACGHAWRVTWDESIRVVQITPYMGGQCFMNGAIQTGDDPTLRASGDNCPPGMEHYWNEITRFRWESRDTGWNKIDLRTAAGLGTPYFIVSTTRPGGVFRNQVYWEGIREIRVPVIEVQSVARPSCFAEGACAGARAESDALAPTPTTRVDPP